MLHGVGGGAWQGPGSKEHEVAGGNLVLLTWFQSFDQSRWTWLPVAVFLTL